VLEAQASGLPVIVSDKGGPKELIMSDETGYVVRSDDRESLSNAVLCFLRDRSKISAMGKKARQFVVTKAIRPEEAYCTILNT